MESGAEKQAAVVKKRKVMVAIDESEGSFYALQWALDHIVAVLQELVIYLVHVQQPFQSFIYPAGPAVYATSSMMESVRTAQHKNATLLFSRALPLCKDYKMVQVETLILEGDPKELICEAVDQMQVDMLVIGSRGLGMIKRAFLGSVSDYCSHHANCPVLIVKPPHKEGKESKVSKEAAKESEFGESKESKETKA